MLQTQSRGSDIAHHGFNCDSEPSILPGIFACGPPMEFIESPDIIFVHMPKAGGTTCEHYLRRYLKLPEEPSEPDEIHIDRERIFTKWLAQPRAVKAKARLFSSKYSANVESYLVTGPRKHLMITMLRNPIQRMVSHYHYIKENPKTRQTPGSCTVKGDQSIEDWYLGWRDKVPDINNFEVRILLTRADAPDIVQTRETSDLLDNNHCRRQCSHSRRKSKCSSRKDWHIPEIHQKHLDIALGRLSRMSLIGILERMEETLAMWNIALPGLMSPGEEALKICGNLNLEHCGRANNTEKYTIHSSLRQQMRKDNWASMALYDYANLLFDTQLRDAKLHSAAQT